MKALLLFAPGWTLATGSPHLALPLLRSCLESRGFEVSVRDLNWEAARQAGVTLDPITARRHCARQSLAEMNEPYFAAEDRLMSIARGFGGKWNAQLGFEYGDLPQSSSAEAVAAIDRPSPFDALFDQVVAEVDRNQPSVIGFSLASTYQIVSTLQLCARLRRAGFDGFIALGGNTISRLAHEMAIEPIFDLIDALVTFQGELPLIRLCKAIESGHSLETVPQLIWRDHDQIRWNTHSEKLDPNSIPAPAYDDLPIGQYWGVNYLNLVAARGCYYGKCNFCAIPYGWGNGGYSGIRSAERVYEDMLLLMERHGIMRFKFVDEALSPRFMRALSTKILEDGVQLEWEGYTRFESAWHDPDFVQFVGKAGFRKGYFGLELIPSHNRSALNKQDRAEPELLLDLCQAAGIKIHLFCMFGYPGTGQDEAARTTKFLLDSHHLIDTADIFPWTYAKHTSVPGATPIFKPGQDWSLEFDHVGECPDVLRSEEVAELASRHEEILWAEVPKLLHPTFRLVSPWIEPKPNKVQIPTAQLVYA